MPDSHCCNVMQSEVTHCSTGQKGSRQGKADCLEALTEQQQRLAMQHSLHQPGSQAFVKLCTAKVAQHDDVVLFICFALLNATRPLTHVLQTHWA